MISLSDPCNPTNHGVKRLHLSATKIQRLSIPLALYSISENFTELLLALMVLDYGGFSSKCCRVLMFALLVADEGRPV